MPAEDCLKIIRDAASDLSDDEITELLEELQRRVDARRADGDLGDLEAQMFNAADEIAADVAQAAQVEKRNRLINIKVYNDLLSFVDKMDAATDNPALALTAIDVGINQRLPGARRSVDARAQALFAETMGGMIADLRREGLLAQFNSRGMDRDVARELAEIKPGGEPGVSGSPEARKIAAIVDKYRRAAVARQNRAGAWIKPLPGYITRQTHDMNKIRRAGFDAWRDAILPRLDAEATFQGADPEKFLLGAYKGLTTGRHLEAAGADGRTDLFFAFKGPGNLAKRASQHRVLHFKDADSWFDYNQDFGTRSLIEGFIFEADSSARNTALMEAYGTNPEAMRQKLLDRLKDKYRDDPKKFDGLNANALTRQFDEVTGLTRIPVSPSSAHVHQSVRNVTNMAKLGGAFLSSLADLGFKAIEIQRQGGRNLFEAWGANLTSALEGVATGQRREVAELIGVGLDGQIGDVAARFNATDGIAGKFAKAQQVFFKLNLLAPWTDSNQRGLGLMMARDLAMRKVLDWDNLPQRSMLELYGFDAKRWDLARKAIRREDDGREYLMPDAVRDLPDADIRAYLGKPKAGARAIQSAKDALETDLRAYYVDRVDTAIPTPGARERALLRAGTRPGTAVGEAVRYVAQFKAFPVTVLTKQFGGLAQADSIGQFFRNVASGRADILGLVHLMVGTTLLGYLSQSAKELSKGRSPRDPTLVSTWNAAMLQGGGLGIFGDFMFGEFNRFGRTAVETAAGPVISEVGSLVELLDAARRGEDVAAKSLRTIINNTPFANLFYTRVAFEYLFLFQISEAINPGYLRRMERRIKKEQGQTFVLPPSRAIPRGGGSRLLEGVR